MAKQFIFMEKEVNKQTLLFKLISDKEKIKKLKGLKERIERLDKRINKLKERIERYEQYEYLLIDSLAERAKLTALVLMRYAAGIFRKFRKEAKKKKKGKDKA